jgi:hypothetical protein
VGEFLATFREFPLRKKATSFTIDRTMAKLEAGIGSRQRRHVDPCVAAFREALRVLVDAALATRYAERR